MAPQPPLSKKVKKGSRRQTKEQVFLPGQVVGGITGIDDGGGGLCPVRLLLQRILQVLGVRRQGGGRVTVEVKVKKLLVGGGE